MHNLRKEFNKLAVDGYLGDPSGTDAYAYLRASSARQVIEGSSFTRQVENIHQAACRDKLCIPFELIFFDDDNTGFEFEHRPDLLKLRHEMRTSPRAKHLVLEDIDRLSRNADWQQGFLLEELYRQQIKVHFYLSPGSALERYIRGYMAQEEMRKAKERMRMGNIYKAMSGKVTAKRPRYGYILTKESQYEFHPEESKVMRWLYEQVIYKRMTLYQIAQEMNETGIPTRFKNGFWTPGTLYQLVKSPVYKGEFYANRHYGVKTGEYNDKGRPRVVMRERPKEEWILVEVPAIVTKEEWDLAHEVMAGNAKKSLRNSKKRNWLLSGCILRCAICKEYCMTAIVGGTKRRPIRYYGCNSRDSEKAKGLNRVCYSPYAKADELEPSVWKKIEQLIYDPSVLIQRLEEKNHKEQTLGYQDQLDFIDSQLKTIAKEKQKYEAAYQRDIYTLDEFEERMQDVRQKENTLKLSQGKLEVKLVETRSIEEQKQVVLSALEKVQAHIQESLGRGEQPQEIPFELKRKILLLLVDVIWVDTNEGIFTIEGELKDTFLLDEKEDDVSPNNLAGTGGSGGHFGFISNSKWLIPLRLKNNRFSEKYKEGKIGYKHSSGGWGDPPGRPLR